MFDYYTLKLIWWLLIGILLIGFAVMDGHDMGVGALLPFIGKTDLERRAIINTIAPHWDGNQVWFITAGGAIFAAWPFVYSIAFSGLYWAMLLLLVALFFRPVGFEYRSKLSGSLWRSNWDALICFGSVVPSILFGVAFGNLFLGLPFYLDDTMRSFYTGSFFELLHPFALLCGLISLFLLILQGAAFLTHRTSGDIQHRAKTSSRVFGILLLICFSLAGVWVSQMNGLVIAQTGDLNGALNPLMKTVDQQTGAWLGNFKNHPAAWSLPIGVYVMVLSTLTLQAMNKTLCAFVTSSITVACMILTAGVALFPFVLPSSTHPDMSLTLWDASSSQYTLNVMFWCALIFVPLIIAYTSWAYRVMRGKVTVEYVQANDKSLY